MYYSVVNRFHFFSSGLKNPHNREPLKFEGGGGRLKKTLLNFLRNYEHYVVCMYLGAQFCVCAECLSGNYVKWGCKILFSIFVWSVIYLYVNKMLDTNREVQKDIYKLFISFCKHQTNYFTVGQKCFKSPARKTREMNQFHGFFMDFFRFQNVKFL